MDKIVRKLNQRKNRLWTRYMETRDIDKYKEYCRCRNKVRAVTRRARKEFELRVAVKARDEPKHFWKYAQYSLPDSVCFTCLSTFKRSIRMVDFSNFLLCMSNQ